MYQWQKCTCKPFSVYIEMDSLVNKQSLLILSLIKFFGRIRNHEYACLLLHVNLQDDFFIIYGYIKISFVYLMC